MRVWFVLSIAVWLLTFPALAWEVIEETDDGIKVFRKDNPDSEIVSFAGETILATNARDAFEVLADSSISHEWIPMVAGKKDLVQISETKRLEVTNIDMPWPLDDRYFVNEAEVTFHPDGSIKAFIQSIENPEYKDEARVLGFMKYSSFIFTPVSGGTHVRIEINSDPRGMIPKWMVNMAQRDWPIDFFTGMKEQLVKRNQLGGAVVAH